MRTWSRWTKPAAGISPRKKRSSSGQSALIASLAQLMRVFGREVESVDSLQCLDFAQRRRGERRLALECMQHDAFEQITERHVEFGGECLQNLEQAILEAYAGLGTGNGVHGTMVHCYHGTKQAGPGPA